MFLTRYFLGKVTLLSAVCGAILILFGSLAMITYIRHDAKKERMQKESINSEVNVAISRMSASEMAIRLTLCIVFAMMHAAVIIVFAMGRLGLLETICGALATAALSLFSGHPLVKGLQRK